MMMPDSDMPMRCDRGLRIDRLERKNREATKDTFLIPARASITLGVLAAGLLLISSLPILPTLHLPEMSALAYATHLTPVVGANKSGKIGIWRMEEGRPLSPQS